MGEKKVTPVAMAMNDRGTQFQGSSIGEKYD